MLRYWEEELEIKIPRNEMGHRYYTTKEIEKLKKVRDLKRQGYGLRSIRMMINGSLSKNNEQYKSKEDSDSTIITDYNEGRTQVMNVEKNVAQSIAERDYMKETSNHNILEDKNSNNYEVSSLRYRNEMQYSKNKEYNRTEIFSKEEKMEQFKKIMSSIVKDAIKESQKEISEQIGEKLENGLGREIKTRLTEQDKIAEERYRKLDEAIRQKQKIQEK